MGSLYARNTLCRLREFLDQLHTGSIGFTNVYNPIYVFLFCSKIFYIVFLNPDSYRLLHLSSWSYLLGIFDSLCWADVSLRNCSRTIHTPDIGLCERESPIHLRSTSRHAFSIECAYVTNCITWLFSCVSDTGTEPIMYRTLTQGDILKYGVIFLPRDAIAKLTVCPSVRPSQSRPDSVSKRWNTSLIFSQPVT